MYCNFFNNGVGVSLQRGEFKLSVVRFKFAGAFAGFARKGGSELGLVVKVKTGIARMVMEQCYMRSAPMQPKRGGGGTVGSRYPSYQIGNGKQKLDNR